MVGFGKNPNCAIAILSFPGGSTAASALSSSGSAFSADSPMNLLVMCRF